MESIYRLRKHTTIVFKDTPTITAGAYSANDAVGGLITFANVATTDSRGSGVIQSITIIDDAAQNAELELHLFDRTFTATGNNDAFAPSDDDLENYLGYILVTPADYRSFASNSAAHVSNIGLAYDLDDRSLFCQLVTRGTPTYAATDDLTVKIAILQD